MLTLAEMDSIFEKIICSKSFQPSRTSQRVLAYIRDCINSNKEQDLSESSIAAEVLGKESSFNPYYDSGVRVIFHRLKLRLHEYYRTEGQKDSFELIFPDGQYVPYFQKNSADNELHHKKMSLRTVFKSLLESFERTLDPVFLRVILQYADTDITDGFESDRYILAIRALSLYHLHYLFQEIDESAIAEADLLLRLAQEETENFLMFNSVDFFHHFYNHQFSLAAASVHAFVQSTHLPIKGFGLFCQYLCLAESKVLDSLASILESFPYFPAYYRLPLIFAAAEQNDWNSFNVEVRRFALIPNRISSVLSSCLTVKDGERPYFNANLSQQELTLLGRIAPHWADKILNIK